MENFIFNSILWTLAIYGAIEIIKTIINIYTYTKLKSDGIYIIVAAKNQEDKIEGFLRNFLFRILYGNEENIKNIIVTDLDSDDNTPLIIEKLKNENIGISISNWKDCKDVIDSIKNT